MTATAMEMRTGIEAGLRLDTHRQRVGGKVGKAMEHYEAVEMMATEKYLLDELDPELRDAYEEHFFGCPECAQDVQLGAVFLDQAKVVLPEMRTSAAPFQATAPVRPAPARVEPRAERHTRDWFAWMRPGWLQPAFMVPAFACLLAIVGYQNLAVYPALQAAANGPRILPSATVLHDDTRSAVPVVFADLKLGTTITVEMPAGLNYSSYKLDFYDSNGKMIWTRIAQSDGKGDDTLSFWLSTTVKQDTYKLLVSGVTAAGETVLVKQQMFELQTKK